ncbi:zinc finger and BTB domain-containing protein 32 isoform 2-T3 [Molossus nigricans]
MPLSPTRLPSPYGSDRLVRLAARLRPALCDTMITVGSEVFLAHSLVLAGVSQQLGRRGHWTLVKGISPSTFAQLLYFVYGESVELQPGELGPLEEAARALGVQSLEEACRKARRDRAGEKLSRGLKEHQEEPEKPTRDSERGVGDLGEQRPEFIGAGGREQETVHKHRPPRESPEIAEAMREGQGEQTRSEKLDQSLFGHRGVDGKQEAIMWVRERPGDSEESLEELPGPPPPPGSLQTSITSRPWWAETPWLREGQPALCSFLLLPPGYGTPFSHITPITAAWQEVWPQDQRIPLPLNLHKGLWSPNQLAFPNLTSGKPLTVLNEPCHTVSLLGLGLQESSLSRVLLHSAPSRFPPPGPCQAQPWGDGRVWSEAHRCTCNLCGSCGQSRLPISATPSPIPSCSVQALLLFCLWKEVFTQASDGDTLPSSHRREALLLWPLSPALPGLLGHDQAPADTWGGTLPLLSVRGRLPQPGLHAGTHARPLTQPAPAGMDHSLYLPLLLLLEAISGLPLHVGPIPPPDGMSVASLVSAKEFKN